MRKTISTVLALMLTCIMSADNSGKHLFRMLDTSSGLPDNNVRNMTMLPNGLMCIQTSSMLNLFDGSACRSYRYDATRIPYTEYSGLSHAYFDEREDMLWSTTRDHIWAFDLKTRRFEYDIMDRLYDKGLEESEPETLFIDDEGRIWLVEKDGKVRIYDRTKDKVQIAMLPAGMDFPITFRQHGSNIWILS